MENDRFFVKSLKLENFRCFENVELGPFDPNFNLVVGANGVGKSSVLVAIANALRKTGSPDVRGLPSSLIVPSDIRIEHWVGKDAVTTLRLCLPSEIKVEFELDGSSFVTSDYFSDSMHTNTNTTKIDGDRIHSSTPWSELYSDFQNGSIPLILLYGTARNFSYRPMHPAPIPDAPGHRLTGLNDWSNAGTSALGLREWLKNQTLAALQHRLQHTEGSSAGKFLQLSLVHFAIVEAVENASSIGYDADREDLVIQFLDGSRRDFRGLSDGQRALIGLVSDIARRVCLLNAGYLGAQTLRETTGLVLIDELDLHLHPKWQRRIIGDLKRIFPKIQFFATTHSPQVIGEARPEEIVLLTPQGQKRPIGSYGMDSNWVLVCVMEAEGRDPAIARRIKDLFDAIDQDRIEEAKGMIAALRADIGNAPDIVGAESYIWRIEHQGDEAAE